MKFKSYLKEEIVLHEVNILEYIEKNCKEFLLESRGNYVYRGMQKNDDYIIKSPRKDRKPKSVPLVIHKLFDKAFQNAFGWKVRSEGVFTNSNRQISTIYGNPYYFFPIGKFKYIWSPDVYDLLTSVGYILEISFDEYIDIKQEKTKLTKNDLIKYYKTINNFIKKHYTNKNLFKAIQSENEIVFSCNKYLAVRYGSNMAKEIDTVYGK